MTTHPSPSISEWYSGRDILITGATGFMGKVLIEKILRSLPDVNAIYVLIRMKRGSTPKQRVVELTNSPMFDKLRVEAPRQFAKIIPINGDVLKPGLDICNDDLATLQKKVTVVFHCAATVRFDQKLKDAVNLNVGGTKRVLEMAKTFDKLDVFLHVSTSYCHCHLEVLEEEIYPAPHPPEGMLELVQWMPDDILEQITPMLLGTHPNTYSYTKCLSEELVNKNKSDQFPICIARPTIVIAATQEPIPGWIESLNGPTGLIVGAGKGVIRSMLCNEEYLADIIPVDISINALIMAAWNVGVKKPKETLVVNVTQSDDNPISWGESLQMGRKHVYENPFSIMLWYPDGSIKTSIFAHKLCVIFFHFLPAYVLDALFVLLRKKPFLVKLQERIQHGLNVLDYYTQKQWRFTNKRLQLMEKEVSSEERAVFPIRTTDINWDVFMRNYVLAIRKYILHEDPSNIPQARKILNRMYYLDRVVQIIIVLLGFYCLYHYTSIFYNATSSVVHRINEK